MIRLLISTFFHLAANFVGLLVADLLFDDFSIQWEAYIFAVALFTLVEVIAGPLVTKIALSSVPALRGGVALVTSFIGLLVTDLLFDGVSISGAGTWIAATVIVWLGGLLAALVLPLILFRKATGRDQQSVPQPQAGTWSP
jgi:hypothetical protein